MRNVECRMWRLAPRLFSFCILHSSLCIRFHAHFLLHHPHDPVRRDGPLRPRLRAAECARCQIDQRSGFAASAPFACVFRLYPAPAIGECIDAATDGRHRHHTIEQVGDRFDRSLHNRAAGDRRADVAIGGSQGASMGKATVAAIGLWRARGPRSSPPAAAPAFALPP